MLTNEIKRINETVLECLNEDDEIKIVKKFTELGQKIIQADYGFVWLNSPESLNLELGYISPNTPFKPDRPTKGGKNYSAMAHDSPDYVESLKSENDKYDESKYLKSYVIIPLRFKEEIYGTMVLCFKKKQIFQQSIKVLCVCIGNSVAQAITIHRLIVKEQQARELATRQETYFKALVENSHEIIMLLNEKGVIKYVSSSLEKICGIKTENAIGRRPRDFLFNTSDAVADAYLKGTINNPQIAHIAEFNFRHSNGLLTCFEATGYNMLDNPDVQGIILNIRDITAKKKTEMLRETERLLKEEQLKTEFIANAAHEIRTPLAIIRGNADLALMDKNEKKCRSAIKAFKAINHEIEHLSNMITDLSILTSKESSYDKGINLKRTNLSDIIKNAVTRCKTLAKEKRIKIRVISNPNAVLMGDRAYLEKMFLNLFRNAVNYGKVGGWIHVESTVQDGQIEIKVGDNGIGISDEDIPQIFNRFYRAEKSRNSSGNNVGLGLAIVKWIVLAHNGSIEAKSVLGKGTTFVVSLPTLKEYR